VFKYTYHIYVVVIIMYSAFSVVGSDKDTYYYYNPCQPFTEHECSKVAVR